MTRLDQSISHVPEYEWVKIAPLHDFNFSFISSGRVGKEISPRLLLILSSKLQTWWLGKVSSTLHLSRIIADCSKAKAARLSGMCSLSTHVQAPLGRRSSLSPAKRKCFRNFEILWNESIQTSLSVITSPTSTFRISLTKQRLIDLGIDTRSQVKDAHFSSKAFRRCNSKETTSSTTWLLIG